MNRLHVKIKLYQHLTSCSDFSYIVQLFKMPETDVSCILVD